MTTGPGTSRLNATEAARRALDIAEAQAQRVRVPSFGVTEERGPGGLVVPLFRCEIPVCEEYPTSQAAFAAMLDYRQRFRADVDADTLHADLKASVGE